MNTYDSIFLGTHFNPRETKSHRGIFISFDCAISKAKQTKIKDAIRSTRLQRASNATIKEIAQVLNPMIQGWLNYFGKFRKSEMRGVFYSLNERLAHWVHNKYKTINWHQSFEWIRRQIKLTLTMFAHWKAGFVGV